MTNSKAFNFFFADKYRTAIIIIIIISIILFLFVFPKTLSSSKKFKLVYIVMINIMIIGIINPSVYFFNWVIYDENDENNKNGRLLIGGPKEHNSSCS